MSFDAYDTFIEDDFLGGQRLDASTDGRPDARNTAQPIPRETAMPTSTPGHESDLRNDFNFSRTIFPTPPPLYPVTAVTPGATAYPTPNAAWCQS